MRGHRARLVALWTGTLAFAAVAAGASVTSVLAATPPPDCNTPFQSGAGVLNTPQNHNNANQPYLTKTLSNTVSQPGSTTYSFTLSTTRNPASDQGSGAAVTYTANTLTDTAKSWTVNQWANATVSVNAGASVATVASNTATTLTLTANWSTTPAAGSPYVVSFFTELLDCAWDVTQGGNSNTANYATQQNVPSFTSGGQLTIALDVNQSDAICDRVQLKGYDPSTGTQFVDYSNLVGSPNGTACTTPGANTPEVPATVLVAVVGGIAVIGYVYFRRRQRGGPPVTS